MKTKKVKAEETSKVGIFWVDLAVQEQGGAKMAQKGAEELKRKNIFKQANLTKDAEIRTIKKFMVPLDIITLTPEEYENRTSVVAGYAHEGEIVYAG
jgi:hypothetical protein